MSSSRNNNTYKKTSFLVGNNSEFINEFYADYLADPQSLPESWRQFFEGLSDEQKLVYNDLKGPSWSPEKKNIKIVLNEQSQKNKDEFLDFLAIENNQLPDNNHEMKLIFSGDSVIRVVAEVIEVALDDQGEPWNTKNKPKHKVL